jgi:predicted SAM-dependent methyltransferase
LSPTDHEFVNAAGHVACYLRRGEMSMLRSFVKRRMSKGLRRALHDLRQEFYIQRLHRASVKRARSIAAAGGPPVRLNLGSGFRPKQALGWINVDLSDRADLQLDLREPLPFLDNSVAKIYTEHFLEHLNYPSQGDSLSWEVEAPHWPSEALSFLRECRRVLVPGGIFDVVVPDAECIVAEYVGRHEQPFPRYEWWGPKWCNTPMHCVNYVFRQGSEHKYAYDEETLGTVLRAAGFEEVVRRPFNPTTDSENHEIGSLCMQARNPGRSARVDGASGALGLSSSAA